MLNQSVTNLPPNDEKIVSLFFLKDRDHGHKKSGMKAAFSVKLYEALAQGLLGSSSSLPAAITIPAMIAAAAAMPRIMPEPFALLSLTLAGAARLTLEVDWATTGAEANVAATIAAVETLIKRIWMLLFSSVVLLRVQLP